MIGGEESIVFADHQLCDVVLRDGSTLALRPVRESDIDALVAFFNALSPQSRYYRWLRRLRAISACGGFCADPRSLRGSRCGKFQETSGISRTSLAATRESDCSACGMAIAAPPAA